MCIIVKTRCFYSVTINSQSKLKKFSPLFLRYLPRKACYKILQSFMVDSLIWKSRNFHNIFLVKSYDLNLDFFHVLQSVLLKNENNNILKKDASYLKKCLTQPKTEKKKKIERREKKKKKRKMRKSQKATTSIFYFCFFIQKSLYFV